MRVPIGKARRAVTHEEAEAQRAADSGYPVGTITTQSGPVWRVAVPKGMAAQLGGPGVSLGAGYVEVAPASNKPAGAQVVSPATFKSKITPWYKNWKVLAPLGIGAVLVGGGAWYLLR